MAYLLIRHDVADFDKWKPEYDAHAVVRETSGSKGAHLFRSAKDPNEVIILFAWDDLANAQSFAASADLREKMQEAGVLGKPDLYFLEEIEKSSA